MRAHNPANQPAPTGPEQFPPREKTTTNETKDAVPEVLSIRVSRQWPCNLLQHFKLDLTRNPEGRGLEPKL